MNFGHRDRPTCTSEAGRVAARRSLRAAWEFIIIDKLTKRGRSREKWWPRCAAKIWNCSWKVENGSGM